MVSINNVVRRGSRLNRGSFWLHNLQLTTLKFNVWAMFETLTPPGLQDVMINGYIFCFIHHCTIERVNES